MAVSLCKAMAVSNIQEMETILHIDRSVGSGRDMMGGNLTSRSTANQIGGGGPVGSSQKGGTAAREKGGRRAGEQLAGGVADGVAAEVEATRFQVEIVGICQGGL